MDRTIRSHIQRVLQPLTSKGWAHWARMLALLFAGIYAGHELKDAPWLTDMKFVLYQKQMQLLRPGHLYPRRTALVLLDDDDFYGSLFQQRNPINRAGLARILERLNAIGVGTVVLDFDLRSPKPQDPHFTFPLYQAENATLLESLKKVCAEGRHLVLTSELDDVPDGKYVVLPSIYTDALPQLPCVTSGYLQLPVDMRTVPGPAQLSGGGYVDSLSLATVKVVDPIAYGDATRKVDDTFRFGQFLSPSDYGARNGRQFIFSGGDLDRLDLGTLRTQLADKIVIVSGNWSLRNYGSGNLIDMHPSPGGEMPGAMLHANYIEALLDRTGTFNGITDIMAELLESGLVIVLAVVGVLNIHGFWKWGAFATGMTVSLLLTYVLLQNLGLFLDFFIPLLMIAVHTLVEEFLAIRHELHHARLKLRGHHE